jgi:hypothetical protein
VRFAAKMAGGWAHGRSQVPLDHREFLISALDYKPVNRTFTHDPANLALKFFQTRHARSGVYFFSAASRLRSAAMVAAEESFRLLFFGRRFVLLV